MFEEEIKDFSNISKNLRKLNKKIKLLSLLQRAKKEYDENNLEECINLCKKVLSENPQNPSALRGIGCVMQAKGDYDEALKYYNKALKQSKNKEIEYTLIGTVYYNQKDLENAIKFYNLAIETNDDYDLAYEGRNQSILENHLQILDMQDELIRRNLF